MSREDYTLDEPFPSKRLVKQVIYQCWGSDYNSPKEILEAWCLRDLMSRIDDASRVKLDSLQKHLIDNGLIEETGEPDYYRPTSKGNDLLNGGDYEPVDPTTPAKEEPTPDPRYSTMYDDENMEQNYGPEGRWRPLYMPELAITDLKDDHLSNAILWVDKKMTYIVEHFGRSEWTYLCYLVRKSNELKAEAAKRSLSVPVGKEPPAADAYATDEQKKQHAAGEFSHH